MPGVIEQMIDYAWRPTRGTKLKPGGRKNPDNFQYYSRWGFTIYRTYYGKESDEYWHSLLYSLRHQTKLAFGAFEDGDEQGEDEEDTDQDDRLRLRDVFLLEVREDPSLLDGLDVRGLREFCNAEKFKETEVIERGNQKLRVDTRPIKDQGMADEVFDFVLLADEAVLKDIEKGEYIVKAVSLLWDEDSGWGWMRIPTGYLLDFWNYLMWNDDRTESCLYFGGTEEDLALQIWPGDVALHFTGRCSEIRPWRYYTNQNEELGGEYYTDNDFITSSDSLSDE